MPIKVHPDYESPRWRHELLPVKELADRLQYSAGYVYAMRRAGFPMPARRASVQQALDWLQENPGFTKNGYLKSTNPKDQQK